ncbi:MAG: translocation/assembly module TamB domain-containing protein, partial [Muribaculaceae bacterium]|nr:translocation/assembly module TamB domain-containing protein [Muribaculaceae bacterium]
ILPRRVGPAMGKRARFGINQYEKTVDGNQTQAMTYSYRVSKSLFDDRFKIVVGGNYTTDAQADENFAENLIADISFEYMLNKQGTMYVRLFRHTGYESILEGEITQTGVGFVYKRKLHRLSDMFRFLRRGKPSAPQLPREAQPFTPASEATQPEDIKQTTDTEKEK